MHLARLVYEYKSPNRRHSPARNIPESKHFLPRRVSVLPFPFLDEPKLILWCDQPSVRHTIISPISDLYPHLPNNAAINHQIHYYEHK